MGEGDWGGLLGSAERVGGWDAVSSVCVSKRETIDCGVDNLESVFDRIA